MQEAVTAVLNGRSLADVVLFLLPLAVIPVLSLYQRRRYARLGSGEFPRPRLYRRFILQQWLLVLCLGVLWWGRGRPLGALGLDLPLSEAGKIGLMLCTAAAPLLLFYRFFSLRRLSDDKRSKLLAKLAPSHIAPRTPGEALLFVPVALTAGISEELLYRGFLLWYLAPAMSVMAAVALSAALFGLAHLYQGWRSMLLSAGMGFVFGVLYATSGSLWWVMGLHALNDLQFCVVGMFLAAWNRGKLG